MKNIFKLLAFLPLLTACDDLFEPALENNRDLEAMYKEPSYAQGILANAYIILPFKRSRNMVEIRSSFAHSTLSTFSKKRLIYWIALKRFCHWETGLLLAVQEPVAIRR